MTVTLPERLIRGSESARTIDDVMRPRNASFEHLFWPGQEALGHYYLPPFQRPAVWTEAQSARLVESVLLGVSIGAIVVTGCRDTRKVEVDGRTVERFPYESEWILDGQQRMRAIARYLADDLVVFRGTANEHRWSDLTARQQRGFGSSTIGFITIGEVDAEEALRVYERLALGGTTHAPEHAPTEMLRRSGVDLSTRV